METKAKTIGLQKLAENLRQERITFEQRKRQDRLWFILKLIMGFSSVVLLSTVLILAGYVLLKHDRYPAAVVTSASMALFVDVVGLMIAVWKIVLNPKSITKLEPITKIK